MLGIRNVVIDKRDVQSADLSDTDSTRASIFGKNLGAILGFNKRSFSRFLSLEKSQWNIRNAIFTKRRGAIERRGEWQRKTQKTFTMLRFDKNDKSKKIIQCKYSESNKH